MKTKTAAITLAFALASIATSFAGSRAYELSSRANVGTGDQVLIGGVIVGDPPTDRPCEDGGTNGKGPITFVVRALGQSLADAHVPMILVDPSIEFYDGSGTLIGSQNDYTENSPEDTATIAALGLTPAYPSECAMLLHLLPGDYTAIVRGENQGTGNALLELYKISAQ